MIQQLATLAGALGIALCAPIAIVIVGLPVVLAARGIIDVVTWLTAVVLK